MARAPRTPADFTASPGLTAGVANTASPVSSLLIDDDEGATDPSLAPDGEPARTLTAEELASQPAFAQAIAIAMRAMGVSSSQPAPNGAVVAGIEPLGVKRGYTRIILEDKADIPPTGQPIGVNGRAYILQPGIPADVPNSVLEVLDNAVEDAAVIDEKTRKAVGWRKRKRFPYQVLERGLAA